jgi:hypothetical protein
MCDPTGIMIGMAIGAATGAAGAAITGQDVMTGALMGGIMGGVTGGFFPGSVGVTPGLDMLPGAGFQMMGAGVSYGGMATAGAIGLAGSVAKGILMPEPEYSSEAYDYSPIAYNNMENQVTGSGGHQASAVLASEIKRAKAKRAKPKESSGASINTESFANSGLQLA